MKKAFLLLFPQVKYVNQATEALVVRAVKFMEMNSDSYTLSALVRQWDPQLAFTDEGLLSPITAYLATRKEPIHIFSCIDPIPEVGAENPVAEIGGFHYLSIFELLDKAEVTHVELGCIAELDAMVVLAKAIQNNGQSVSVHSDMSALPEAQEQYKITQQLQNEGITIQ